ncbi:hypothetical protein ACFFRR_001136 [Megaselia abdita]
MFLRKSMSLWLIFSIVLSNAILSAFTYPQTQTVSRIEYTKQNGISNNGGYPESHQHQKQEPLSQRKFAVKPNASKKVALDDIDEDVEPNQLQDNNGFSWTNVLSTVMQMFFNNGYNAPSKSDDVDGVGGGPLPSPWTNVISIGLKIFNAVLGGYPQQDNIDKVDNGGSPLQGVLAAVFSSVLGGRNPDQINTMAKQAGEFITIVVNLLDALRTSFSQRSLAARSIGKRDSVSDAAVASISMVKSYIRTYKNSEDPCAQKYICEANTECVKEIGGTSIFCQLGTLVNLQYLI